MIGEGHEGDLCSVFCSMCFRGEGKEQNEYGDRNKSETKKGKN